MKFEIARGHAGRTSKVEHSIDRSPDGGDRHSIRRAAALVLIAVAVAGGGCMRDCRNAYCDAVRAGATAVQAWHFHCCNGPDPSAMDCDDLPNRIARFSLLAAEAREVCEAQNWGRLRDIWREFRGLIPLRFVSTVWREACGRAVPWGENRWTPFGPEIGFSISLPFEVDEPPRIVFGDASTSRPILDDSTGMIAWVERTRTLGVGSSISVRLMEGMVKAAASGRLVVATRIGSNDPQEACDLIRPVEFRLDLLGEGWSGGLELVEGYEGNRIIETEGGVEMLGMLVRVDIGLEEPIGISSAGIYDEAFIQVPLERRPGGSIRLGADHLIDGLELLPVDPRLDSTYRAASIGGLQGSIPDCGELARARARAFLDLHPDCRSVPTIIDPAGD